MLCSTAINLSNNDGTICTPASPTPKINGIMVFHPVIKMNHMLSGKQPYRRGNGEITLQKFTGLKLQIFWFTVERGC